MSRFWIAVYVLTAAAHLPFAASLSILLGERLGLASLPIALALSAALVWLIGGRIELAKRDRPISTLRLHLIEEPYFIHWCGAVASVPLSLLLALGVALASLAGLVASPLHALGLAAAAAYLGGLLLSFYGVVVRRRWVRIRSIDVALPGLDPAFDGYRIVQLSDLHIGALGPRSMAERWALLANRAGADLIALTGDYVTSGTAFHEDIAAVLGALSAPDGVVAVMGNHDYFGDGEPLLSLLAERGVRVLRNASMRVARGGAGLCVAGVDDTYTRRADVALALRGAKGGDPIIALCHDPQVFPALAGGGAALVLSGHTHAGQLALPLLWERLNLARLSYRYHAGQSRLGESLLYVHPGLGTTGPPIRIGAAPEITVFRLRAAEPPAGARGSLQR
ncbi:MAG: metallophosphoesterase [Byssovorax sp.]